MKLKYIKPETMAVSLFPEEQMNATSLTANTTDPSDASNKTADDMDGASWSSHGIWNGNSSGIWKDE